MSSADCEDRRLKDTQNANDEGRGLKMCLFLKIVDWLLSQKSKGLSCLTVKIS